MKFTRTQLVTAGGVLLLIIALVILSVVWRSNQRQQVADEFAFPGNNDIDLDWEGSEARLDADEQISLQPLVPLSNGPVAGFSVYRNSDGQAQIAFASAQNGNIYISNYPRVGAERLTITTIENLVTSLPNPEGYSLIKYERKEDGRIISALASINSNQELRLDERFNRITDAIIDNNDLILLENRGDETEVVRINTSGRESFIASLPLTNLNIVGLYENQLHVSTLSSRRSQSLLLSINLTAGSVRRITGGDIAGSYAVGDQVVLSSRLNNGRFEVEITNSNSIPTSLFVNTMVDKCAYSDFLNTFICGVPKTNLDSNQLPDSWYKGELQLSDNFSEFNPQYTAVYPLLYTEDGLNLDVIDPVIIDSYMIFRNKTDNTLWLLNIDTASVIN